MNVIDKSRKFSSLKTARDILGQDFFSPAEISDARKVIFSPEKLKYLKKYVPSEEILIDMKENNGGLLAVHQPINLLEIPALKIYENYSEDKGWYLRESQKEAYGRDKTTFGWFAGRKDELPGTSNESWDWQNHIAPKSMIVPNAAEGGLFISTFKTLRSESLFTHTPVRTSSAHPDYYKKVKLRSDSDNLIAGFIPDWDSIGISLLVAWKLDQPAFTG